MPMINTLKNKIKTPSLFLNLVLPFLVLCTGLAITYQLWNTAMLEAKQALQQDFDFQAYAIETQIKARIKNYSQLLHSGRGLFLGSKNVERTEFKAFVEALEIKKFYPGIQGLGFSMAVPAAKKQLHLLRIQKQGFPHYNIHPTGDRDFYTSIVYLEPFDWRNQRAFGFDMYSEITRRTAMQLAVDKNEVVLSGKVQLVQETDKDKQAGFLMYLPVYHNGTDVSSLEKRRANLIGWVYSPFRAKDFVTGVLEEFGTIDIELYDGELVLPEQALFLSHTKTLEKQPPLFKKVKTIMVAGHYWTLDIHSHPKFDILLNLERAIFIAGTGISSSILFGFIIWLLLNGRRRALRLAGEITEELAKSEERFKTLFNQAPIGIALIDSLTGHIYNANEKYAHIVGLTTAQLQSIDWMTITHPDDIQTDLKNMALMNSGKTNGFTMEKRYIHANSSIVWINLTVAKMQFKEHNNPCHHCIVEDITERKQADQTVKEQHALLMNVINSLSHPFYVVNTATYTVLLANKSAGQWIKNKTTCYQLSHKQQFPCMTSEGHPCPVNRVAQTKKPVVVEHQDYDEKGERRTVEIFAYPIFNAAGEVYQLIEYVIDITERKQLEKKLHDNQAFTNSVLDSITSYITVIDSEGFVLSANQSWLKFAEKNGLPEHKGFVRGDNYFKLFQQAFKYAQLKEAMMIQYGITSVLEGDRDSFEFEYACHSETEQNWFYLYVAPLLGEKKGVVVSHENITQRKQIENQLRISEQKFRSLIEYLPLPLGLASNTGKLVYINKRFRDVFRYTLEEISSLDLWYAHAYPDENYRQQVITQWTAAVEKAQANNTDVEPAEYHITCKNGEVRVMLISGIFFETDLLATFMDITERKHAEQKLAASESKLRLILESEPECIKIIDAHGRLQLMNRAGLEMIEADFFAQVEGKQVLGLIAPEYRNDYSGLMERVLAGETLQMEYEIIGLKGGRRWLETHAVPMLNPKGTVEHLAVTRDISERKRVEMELRSATEKAIKANQAKSEFLANMSHEIRTPMNAILGFSDILNNLITDPTQHYYLDAIHRSGKTLLQLINDILDLSKIEAGKFTLQYKPVAVKTIVKDIQLIFSQKAADKNIELSVFFDEKLPDALLLDEIRLRQVLLNLVGNAIKFTEQGFIKIVVTIFEITAETVNLNIEIFDSGIGIPQAQQEKIFAAFTQQENQSVKFGGTGLGLTISKRLAELMDGHISVKSEMGKGSCFNIQLNQVQVLTDVIKEKPEEFICLPTMLHFQPAKILLVDDIAMNRQLIVSYFAELPELTFIEAETGEQALSLVSQQQFDLILMDRRLPNMNGDEVCQYIKALPDYATIPIIMISASVLVINKSQPHFYDLQLSKPVNKTKLLNAMQSFLPFSTYTETTLQSSFQASIENSKELINPELLAFLISTYQAVIKAISLSEVMEVDVLIELAEELLELAYQYDCTVLINWATDLKTQAELFDIANLAKTLKSFDSLLM